MKNYFSLAMIFVELLQATLTYTDLATAIDYNPKSKRSSLSEKH
jgi:hypothetical protein